MPKINHQNISKKHQWINRYAIIRTTHHYQIENIQFLSKLNSEIYNIF